MSLRQYQSLVFNANWRASKLMLRNALSDEWRNWLLHKGSLTKKLSDYANGEFGLRVLGEEWGIPLHYEANKLGLKLPQWSMIREVELACKGVPTVYARSIIPHQVYQENKNTLATMGSKPLGHFLSRSALLQPSMRDICELRLPNGARCYGRATLYSYNSGTILVQEFFVDPSIAG